MTALSPEAVLEALRSVKDPELDRSLVELEAARNIRVDDGRVSLEIALPRPAHPDQEQIESQSRAAIAKLEGVRAVELRTMVEVRGTTQVPGSENLLPGVKNLVLIGSGKGGVGKSTVAANLAIALAQFGARVGLLDADIYGPSMPIMMGAAQPTISEDRKLIPIPAHGVTVMSIGYLVDPSRAMVWRGPMLNGAVIQLMKDVEWGELDYLVVDLPPGTGDVQLTIAQRAAVAGAAIVTTPQRVALADVVRAKQMFDQVNIPTLGVIENMSSFVCPNCETSHEIFAKGGGERAAHQLGIDYLGTIPIDPRIREGGDRGTPLLVAHPDSPATAAFKKIAGRLAGGVARQVITQASGQIPIHVVGPTPPS